MKQLTLQDRFDNSRDCSADKSDRNQALRLAEPAAPRQALTDVPVLHSIHTGSWGNPNLQPVGTGSYFPRERATGTSIYSHD
jgi:hypothetical protein